MRSKTKKIGLAVFVAVLLTTMCSVAGAYRGYCGTQRSRLRWSMYAHALVPEDLYYSPYAFGHGHNGLVSDNYYSAPCWPVVRRKICHQIPEERSYELRRTLAQDDARKVIHDYLKSKGIVGGFTMTNILSGNDGKIISVDFVFKHKSIVIKFWDLKSMSGAVDRRKKHYENYIAKWQEFQPAYLAQGGKIYLIMSSKKADIEKELESILSTCL